MWSKRLKIGVLRRHILQDGRLKRFLWTDSRLQSEKSFIESVILDELRDTSKIAPSPKSNTRNERILILNPEQTADKKFHRLMDELHNDSKTRKTLVSPVHVLQNELIDDKLSYGEDSYMNTIENLKPLDEEITITRFESLQNQMTGSFTKTQLTKYITEKYNDPTYGKPKRGLSKTNKKKLSEIIINDIWEIVKSDKLTTIDDIYIKRSIKLTKLDLFLLLSENGFIIQYLSRVGAKITFDSKNDKIQFTGTESQVNNAEINLHSILNNSHREQINLSSIKKLFLDKYKEFPLSNIGKNTEVYFNHLHNDNYELITLNGNQIKRSKRLLLWLLSYNQHLKESLNLPEKTDDLDFMPYKDDDSLSWNNRHQALFTLKKVINNNANNEFLLNDLKRYSDENLLNNDLEFETTIEDAKSLPVSEQKTDVELEEESWKLLNDLGITSDNFESKKETEVKEEHIHEEQHEEETDEQPHIEDKVEQNECSNELIKPNIKLTEQQKDQLYHKLIDFSYRNKLNGLSDNKLNNPIFIVTLGNILFEGEKSEKPTDKLIPNKPKFPSDLINYKFNSNLQLVNDKILSLPLYNYPNMTTKEINQFLTNDPHNYVIQLKFLPSPFIEGNVDQINIENQIKYPPVEIWIELNEKSKPDIETMNIVTVEGENNCYISIPNGKSDMKVSCQVSGDLLKEEDTEENKVSEKPENLNEILNSTTSRYSRFASQPGVSNFLSNSKLDFSGKVATSIAPYIDLNINGETVRYHYINVSYRRQLDLNYGDENNDRLVQFNIVEGGSLGGRKVEVNLVGDLSGKLDKESFNKLIDDSINLISEL